MVKTVRSARDSLILNNQGLVGAVAKRLLPRMQGCMKFEDLFSAGQIGLVRAADTFDPSRGCKFSTHATWKIYGAITAYLDHYEWVPKHYREQARKSGVKLDLPVFHPLDIGLTSYSLASGERDPAEAVSGSDFFARVVEGLPATERHTILLMYRDGLSAPEVGGALGLSRAAIYLARKRAFRKIRKQYRRS